MTATRPQARAGVACLVVVVAFVAVSCGGDNTSTESSPSRSKSNETRGRFSQLIEASGFGDPTDVEMPPPENDAARAWLEGDGAAAVRLARVAEQLWRNGRNACTDVAKKLDAIGTPEKVLAAAAGTPDGPTQEVLVDLHTTVAATLRACDDRAAFDTMAAELAWQWALTDTRLDDLGVRR